VRGAYYAPWRQDSPDRKSGAVVNERRLIVNADDFGLSRSVTDGVLKSHHHGIVTSASLMVNQPASEYALEALREMPNLGVGIHLNLCAGRSVLSPREVPTLVNTNGEFHHPAILFRKLWRFQVNGAEIEAEFRAQIRWLMERGVIPIHADSHLHAHLYPAALKPFVRALESEGIRCVRSPRCSVWPASGPAGGPHEGPLARRVLVHGYRSALQFTSLRNFVMPHSRVSFRAAERRDHSTIGQSWIAALNHLPSGTFELACHPGTFEAGFSESDRIAAQRTEELHWLTSAALREAVERNGVRLVRYADISSYSHVQLRIAKVSAA
jgi:predicted glycoside hydrolase/deacetylase ChbG (UPF0249 family)